MPMASVNGIKLYYEVTGSGYPLLFSHEFAGDYRSWEPQVRYFSRRYQVITYNARGYPPSEVPEDINAYSQEQAADDIVGLMRHLSIAQAHLVGLSMGGYAVLHFGLRYPTLARSLVVAGCGYGSVASERQRFQQDSGQVAQRIERDGMRAMAAVYANARTTACGVRVRRVATASAGPDPHCHWGRGRTVPGAGHLYEAHDSYGGPTGYPQERSHHQH